MRGKKKKEGLLPFLDTPCNSALIGIKFTERDRLKKNGNISL